MPRIDLVRVAQSATKTRARLLLYLNERKNSPLPDQIPKPEDNVRLLYVPDGVLFRIVFCNGNISICSSAKILWIEGMPWGENHGLVKKLTGVAYIMRKLLGLTNNDDSGVTCIYGVVKFGGDVVIYDAMDIIGADWEILSHVLFKDREMIERACSYRRNPARKKTFWKLEDIRSFVDDLKAYEAELGYTIDCFEDIGTFEYGKIPTDTWELLKWVESFRNITYEEFIDERNGSIYVVWPDRSKMFRICGNIYYSHCKLPPYMSPRPGRRLEDYETRIEGEKMINETSGGGC